MSYCQKCGSELKEGGVYCGKCGYDTRSSYDPDQNKKRVSSAFAYWGILFFLPLAICPGSKYGRFHANQGLVIFICNLVIGFVGSIVVMIFTFLFLSQAYIYDIPSSTTITVVGLVGMIIGWLMIFGFGIFTFVLQIMGTVNAAKGKEKELPLIRKFKLIK